jgi:hypothetical protein
MAAPVIVYGLPAPPPLRGALLSACSDALKHRACIAGDEADRVAEAPAATAIIALPDGTDRHVRISLERLDVTPHRRSERDTRFAGEDPVIERWRTAGLVVAALMGESEITPEHSAPADDRVPLTPANPDRSVGFVAVTAQMGPGLDDGTVRIGAVVRGALTFRSPVAFIALAMGHTVRPSEPGMSVSWSTFGAGAGARTVVPGADLGLRVRVEVLLEYLQASTASGAALAGGGSRLLPGLSGGVDAVWPASSPIAVTAGFSLWALSGGTAIRLDQEKVGSSRWLSYAGLLGGQWSFR